MNQPRSGDGARRLGVEGCHTRAAFHGPSHCGWGVALEVQGGWSKVQRQDLVPDHCPSHWQVFFLFSAFPVGWAETALAGRQRDASRAAGGLARPNAAPPRLHCLASTIRALSRAGFENLRRGRIRAGLFSQFSDSSRSAMFVKGTMGTWEQAMSKRQRSARLDGANLFPDLRAAPGTWEQVWAIPMQENPRACGCPLPPPAGERG